MPSYQELLEPYNDLNYWDFMENFIEGTPGYNYPINRSLEPHALEYVYNNKCN